MILRGFTTSWENHYVNGDVRIIWLNSHTLTFYGHNTNNYVIKQQVSFEQPNNTIFKNLPHIFTTPPPPPRTFGKPWKYLSIPSRLPRTFHHLYTMAPYTKQIKIRQTFSFAENTSSQCFYKMYHSLVPSYLSSLIPRHVGDMTTYNLRNSSSLRNISCRTQLLSKSFLPSTISSWNSLPDTTRNAPSLSSFKQRLNTSIKCIPSFYYEGDRNSCVQHARLRMHCSHLNEHLFSKNLIDSPLCLCGSIEDTFHFFLTCPLYLEQRFELYNQLFAFRPITIQLLLFGCKRNPEDTNSYIFKCVHNYIRHTKRF